ncbi:hypothetical protein FKM82_030556 [Ascaphus truei]
MLGLHRSSKWTILQREFAQFRHTTTALNHTPGGRMSCRGKPPYKRLSTISTVTEAKVVIPSCVQRGSHTDKTNCSNGKGNLTKGSSFRKQNPTTNKGDSTRTGGLTNL